MSRVFISGSSTGLGLAAANLLVSKGHKVVLHARNAKRADDVREVLPRTEAVVAGDIETIAGAKDVAAQVNALGQFDAVIHNAAVGYREGQRVTADGLPHVFSNSLEPGWVPAKMGDPGAPDDMDQAHLTQAWLAAGDDPRADVTGQYFYHLKRMAPNPQSHDVALQDRLIAICSDISGVVLPT